MRNFSLFFCLLFPFAIVVPSSQIGAQELRSPANTARPVATAPFELFHNRVYVPVQVNGHENVSMVLDTGAAFSGLSQVSAQTLQLQTKGKAQLAGNGESRLPITLAKDVAFRLGDAELIEKSVAIVPFKDLEAHEGRTIAGVLGVDLFRHFVVVIDYAARTLRLYEPESFVYQGPGEIVPLHFGKAALFHATISIPGRDPMTAQLAVDSGTYSALRLYRPFAQKHDLLQMQIPLVDSIGFGIGGEFPEKLGHASTLEIGALRLNEPVMSVSVANVGATASAAYDGTIGGAVLRRFTVTFDYPRQQMILEPNAGFAEPFQADRSGLLLQAAGRDLKIVSISHILANSPAAAVGIREGDTILSVNGVEAQNIGLEGIRGMFCDRGVYHLQLRREQQNLEVDITTDKRFY
jgi:hypothetical protein